MEEAVFIVFRKPTNASHLLKTEMQVQAPKAAALSNLKIVKAEYGTFLQEGLIDITEQVNDAIKDGKLDFKITRAFCDCDPAMGYKKEFRMVYQIGDTQQSLYAEEREHIELDAGSKKLKVLKAIFGKFKAETIGVPESYKIYDVTEYIKKQVAAGTYSIPVNNTLIENKTLAGNSAALKITFETDGEEQTKIIPKGQICNLAKDNTKARLVYNNDGINWLTPNAGKISFTTLSGETKSAEVKSVPAPIALSGVWDVTFPNKRGATKKAIFDELDSWTNSSLINAETDIALDLGSVRVIAEVILNGKNVGTLWKAPFRISINDFVKKGTNVLEIKITNLWANRLIGDEHLPLDFERKGKKIKRLPDWLLNQTRRPSERITFASFKHWNKDDDLQMSGLLGPVKIIVFKKINILND
jgi:hypothetical protein